MQARAKAGRGARSTTHWSRNGRYLQYGAPLSIRIVVLGGPALYRLRRQHRTGAVPEHAYVAGQAL